MTALNSGNIKVGEYRVETHLDPSTSLKGSSDFGATEAQSAVAFQLRFGNRIDTGKSERVSVAQLVKATGC